nr:MAG TPA: hypothetical protein [Caudoviricetes sp.]
MILLLKPKCDTKHWITHSGNPVFLVHCRLFKK